MQKLPVYWIRAVNGDEFVTRAQPSRDGWTMFEPTMITTVQSQMILAPYGMMARERTVFVENSSVLHANEVTDIMTELYEASIKSVDDVVQGYFNSVIQKLIDTARVPLTMPSKPSFSELLTEATSDENLKKIAELSQDLDDALGRPPEFKGVEVDRPRTRQETIDNLMKLAEKAGKGKK